jgi:ABC-type branched-subunit amino acid transport system substrate-binding protein
VPPHRVARTLFAAGFAGLVALVAGSSVVARADSSAVAVDRQNYTVTTPQNTDPYNNDTTNIHVGAANGGEVADSFVHLELDGLPPGAVPTGGTLTLRPTKDQASDARYNVNRGAAILEACVLATEQPVNFDPKNPPASDCLAATSVGKAQPDGSWTFDLAVLMARWKDHNTGAEIRPIPSGTPGPDPTNTWSLGFDISLNTATVDYTLPGQTATQTTQPTAPTTVIHSGGGVTAYVPTATTATPPAAAPTPAPSASPAPAAAAAVPAVPPSTTVAVTTTDALLAHWPLVLLGGLLLGAVLLARPLAAAGTAGAFKLGVLSQLRNHPRAFAVSAVAVAWCTTYSAYAAAVGPTATHYETRSPATAAAPQATATPATGGSAGATAAPGATPGSTAPPGNGNAPAAQAANTPGSYENVNGVQVFVPANGGPPVAQLFSPQEDRVGITDTEIHLCAHAALTFGQAFNTNPNDFQVFWQYVNDHGGINGRKVTIDFKDDGYQPANAVQAAQSCYDENPALLVGGIGFDQIPAVRVWAEQHHELYIHHDATIRGTGGQRYSFSALPSVEALGEMFAQMVIKNHPGKKVGILYRQSDNWDPGRIAFDNYLKSHGHGDMLGPEIPVQANQGSYSSEIAQLQAQNVQVAWAWENALAATEMIKQAKSQQYPGVWMVFPFNITLQGLSSTDALNPPIEGVAAWPAYTNGDYSGPYASYAADIHEFEREYAHYDSGANLAGPGGDLLFLAWTEFKGLADILQQCGRNCTRNEIAGIMLSGYHKTVSPNCDVDFSRGDPHHGGYLMETWQTAPFNGAAEWRPVRRCVSQL